MLDGGGRIVAGDKFKDVARSIEIVDGMGLPIEKKPLHRSAITENRTSSAYHSTCFAPSHARSALGCTSEHVQRKTHISATGPSPKRNWGLTQNIFSVTLSNVQPFSFTLREDNMKKISVEHTIWLAAPRERIWQAVTEPEQNAFGFGMMLENLQAYLLDTNLPYPYGF